MLRKSRLESRIRIAVLSALLVTPIVTGAVGCAGVAVGAAAGAVGAIEYTDRGAKSEVKGDVNEVNKRAQEAMKEMGIAVTGSEMKDEGKERDLDGKTKKFDVSINMKTSGKGITHVEVVARESLVKWNKDYAKSILSKIVHES